MLLGALRHPERPAKSVLQSAPLVSGSSPEPSTKRNPASSAPRSTHNPIETLRGVLLRALRWGWSAPQSVPYREILRRVRAPRSAPAQSALQSAPLGNRELPEALRREIILRRELLRALRRVTNLENRSSRERSEERSAEISQDK